MASCPVCSAQINEDFGLITCPQCGSQVLLGMDGPVADSPSVADSPPPLSDELSRVLVADMNSELPPLPEDVVMGEIQENPPEPLETQPPEGMVQAFEDPLPPPMETPNEEFVPPAAEPAPQTPATPDMSELAEYGNSQAAEGQGGFLRFNITVSGIDTVDLRKEVAAALDDQRFLWDAEALSKSIRKGELRLNELTAVKAAILIQRLRHVAVDIRWEQYTITG